MRIITIILSFFMSFYAHSAVFAATELDFDKAVEWEVLGRFRTILPKVSTIAATRYASANNQDEVDKFIKNINESENRFHDRLDHLLRCYPQTYNSSVTNACREGATTVRGLVNELNPNELNRFRTSWNPALGQYSHGSISNKARFVSVKVSDKFFTDNHIIKSKAKCVWNANGKNYEGACHRVLSLAVGENPINLSIYSHKKAIHLTGNLKINHVNILVVGDSFSSGEGNPHRPQGLARNELGENLTGYNAIWWDNACHRSLLAWTVQVAAMKAEKNKHQSVAIYSYACSGAELSEGILGPFTGRETKQQIKGAIASDVNQAPFMKNISNFARNNYVTYKVPGVKASFEMLEPQVSQVNNLLKKNKIKFDYLFTSAGGNDIGFGNAVVQIARSDFTNPDKRKVFMNIYKKELEKINKKYVEYNQHIVKDFKIDPKKVYVLQYPPLTRAEKGSPEVLEHNCGGMSLGTANFLPSIASLFGFGVSKEETQFADSHILKPLNRKIGEIAEKFHWKTINVGSKFDEHGFCKGDKSFAHSYVTSENLQGNILKGSAACVNDDGNVARCSKENAINKVESFSTGAMHPNVLGHKAIADHVFLQMNPQ